jgi:hypothetical protein
MFEAEVRKRFVALFILTGAYLILGIILLTNIRLLGGRPAGKLHGIVFTYSAPGIAFMRFFTFMLFLNLGGAYSIWNNRSLFERHKGKPEEQVKLALTSRIFVTATVVICSGLMLIIIDIFWAFFQQR